MSVDVRPSEVRADVDRLKRTARDRTVAPEDLRDFTFMLSNFGMIAGRYATPVVVPPAVAILGAGKLSHDVVAVMGGIEAHLRMPLSLTFDHRCVTGGEAARFLAALIRDLEKGAERGCGRWGRSERPAERYPGHSHQAHREASLPRPDPASAGDRSHPSIDRRRFLRAYFRGVGDEDLAQRAHDELAAIGLRHLEVGQVRAPSRDKDRALVEVFNPETGVQRTLLAAHGRDDRDGRHALPRRLARRRAEQGGHRDSSADSSGAVGEARWARPAARSGQRRRRTARAANRGSCMRWIVRPIPRSSRRSRRKLESALSDIRRVVDDWDPMRERVREVSESLLTDPPPLTGEEIGEAHALLGWMEARHFVFLGYRHYRLSRGKKSDRLISDARSGLGILRSTDDKPTVHHAQR